MIYILAEIDRPKFQYASSSEKKGIDSGSHLASESNAVVGGGPRALCYSLSPSDTKPLVWG